MSYVGIEVLNNKVITEINKTDYEEIFFYTSDDKTYRMYHSQDCCESVYVEDIIGDLDDLIDSPVTMAEEITETGENGYGSYTWTFYKLATNKGYVTIRWYGTSNGYYSESVYFKEMRS